MHIIYQIVIALATQNCPNNGMQPVPNPPSGESTRPVARGFTAVELLVVIGILGVLFALALPSFQSLIERWRVRQAMEGMQSTLYYARSEAIKRGGNVVVQKLPNGTNGCTWATDLQDFGCGWVVCTSTNNRCLTASGNLAAGATILQRFDTLTNVQIAKTSKGDSITFNRWGLVAGNWWGFNFVPKDQSFLSSPAARSLCMSSAGRIRMTTTAEDVCNN